MPTQRYKLTISYRGTHYHGWQLQPALESYSGIPDASDNSIPTIQRELIRAIQKVVKHPINLVGSSRTDSGVHAKAQIAQFDTDQLQIPIEGMRLACNARLPDDILIRSIEPVPDGFDAIRSTICKRYQYFIWNHYDRPPFFSDMVWHRWRVLDVEPMKIAAQHFVGRHDFASFARPGHRRASTMRTILSMHVHRRGHRLIVGVEGDGFLWNMVRIMVGTLVEVGLGHYQPDDVKQMLEAKDRMAGGPTAPPQGLYLQWIKTNDSGPVHKGPPVEE